MNKMFLVQNHKGTLVPITNQWGTVYTCSCANFAMRRTAEDHKSVFGPEVHS